MVIPVAWQRAVEVGVLHGIFFRCKKQQAVIELDSPTSSYDLLVDE